MNDLQQLKRDVERMPDDVMNAFFLRKMFGYGQQEIAIRMEKTPQQIEDLLVQAALIVAGDSQTEAEKLA